MSMVSPRRRVLLWALLIFVAAGLLLIAIPLIKKRLVQREMTGLLNNARQIQIAMQMMALDSANSGESKGGLPADLGLKSKAELLRRLVQNNYLSATDASKLAEGLTIVNASRFDPPDTALIVRKSGNPRDSGFVVLTLGGSGGFYSRPTDATNPDTIKLPNRQPPILPDE